MSSATEGSIFTPSTTGEESEDFAFTPTPSVTGGAPRSASSSTRIVIDIPPFEPTTGSIGTVPEPGGLYMIRDADSDKVMMVENGCLAVNSDVSTGGGWQWYCDEDRYGWLGLREKCSGKRLGLDGKGGLCTKASVFDAWERLIIRPVEKGGYHLLAIRGWQLLRIGIDNHAGTLNLVGTAEESARWNFIRL